MIAYLTVSVIFLAMAGAALWFLWRIDKKLSKSNDLLQELMDHFR